MNRSYLVKYLAVLVSSICFAGCGEKTQNSEPKVRPAISVVSPVKEFQPRLPSNFAHLIIGDAKVSGLCYLDAINSLPLDGTPITIKAGTEISLAGWAVYDVKSAKLGSAFIAQLLGKQSSYYSTAESYHRKNLGAALGNVKLDGGGLKMEGVTLNVPAGEYRVLFLTQSENNLLRCDTGRILNVSE